MRLSTHFTLTEATKSQDALRHGIANEPDSGHLLAMQLVASRILEPVRAHYGKPFTPSSWFRSATLNAYVGGSEESQHCKGEAVDFEVPGIPNGDLASWIYFNLDFDQMILEWHELDRPDSGWIHVSLKATGNRAESLLFNDRGFTPWAP